MLTYAESLLEKRNNCHDNSEISSPIKISNHTFSGYSLFTHVDLMEQKISLIVKGVKII